MKKLLMIIAAIAVISGAVLLYNNLFPKYPETVPEMTIEYNGEKYKAKRDEYIWIDRPGSGELGDGVENIARELKGINVKQGDEITLTLSFSKGISDIKAVEMIKGYDNGQARETKPIKVKDSKIKVTQEKGEHIYIIYVDWRSRPGGSHGVSYVAKVNIS